MEAILSTDVMVALIEGICILILLVVNILLYRNRNKLKKQMENRIESSHYADLDQALSNKSRG